MFVHNLKVFLHTKESAGQWHFLIRPSKIQVECTVPLQNWYL